MPETFAAAMARGIELAHAGRHQDAGRCYYHAMNIAPTDADMWAARHAWWDAVTLADMR